MKTLFVFVALFVSGLAQAQTLIADAFAKGEVVKIVAMSDLVTAIKTSPGGVMILHTEKASDQFAKSLVQVSAIAKQAAGKMLVATVNEQDLVAAKSEIAGQLHVDDTELSIMVILGNKGFGFAITGDESAAELWIQLQDSAKKALQDAGGKSDEQKTQPLPPAQVIAGSSAPIEGAKAVSAVKSLAKHDFSKVLEAKTDEELNAVLADSKNVPVIVDFSGVGWCGACTAFHPAFEAAAKKFGGKVRFVLVDMKSGGGSTPPSGAEIFASFDGQYVPTVRLFNGGSKASSNIDINSGAGADAFIQQVTAATGITP